MASAREVAVQLGDRTDVEPRERVVHRPDEADAPSSRHEHDAIAQLEVLDGVCREDDRCRAVREPAQTGDQLGTRDRVEPGGRFVEEEDVRLGEQLDGDAGALALPAAQRADPDVGVWVSPTASIASRTAASTSRRGCRRREPEPRGVVERALERQVGVDDVVLRHVSEHAAKRPKVGMDVDAVEVHRSRRSAA